MPGPCLAQKPSTFTLTVESHGGSPFTLPSPSPITGKLSTGGSPVINCVVKETAYREKHSISFIPESSGEHQLAVQVGGVGVPCSPFMFPVMPIPDESRKTVTGLNKPWGVAVSDYGDVVIVENGMHHVSIKEQGSNNTHSFGTKGSKQGELKNPRGVAIATDGHILVTDDHRIQKFTPTGVCVKSVGSGQSGSGQQEFYNPMGIAVHRTTQRIYVADSNNHRIQVFNNDLSFLSSITPKPTKTFKTPFDVGLDSEGYLYVAEQYNHCISKFTTSGKYIASFSSYGSSPGQLYYPTALTINNLVYVTEYGNNRVSIFNTEGNHLHCFGTKGTKEGNFNYPHGIATDTLGNLYVSDTYNHRVIMF